MMAPIGRSVPTSKALPSKADNHLNRGKDDELKDEPPDDRGFHEEVHIKIEKEDEDDQMPSYPAMNDDEGVVIKTEDSDDSMDEDEKPDVDILTIVDDKLGKYDNGEKSSNHHSEDSMKSLLCRVCGKQFFRAYYFNLHIKTHQISSSSVQSSDKPHKCPECGKCFALLQHLTGHARMHIAGRYYECPVCRRKFTELSNLTMHLLKTHPDEKPYKCPECDKQFTQSSALKKHMKSHDNYSSQEDLDRIDMLFYVHDGSDEEPLKKKIKLEKENDKISPVKERSPVSKEKIVSKREEKYSSVKELGLSLKVKSPPKEKPVLSKLKSPSQEKSINQLEEKTLLHGIIPLVKDESSQFSEIEVLSNSHPKSSADIKVTSPVDLSDTDQSSLVDVYIKEEPSSDSCSDESDREAPPSPKLSQETPTSKNITVTKRESTPSVPVKNVTPVSKCRQASSPFKEDDLKEPSNQCKDSPLVRNGVPLDKVQNPQIKITKYAKGPQDCEPLSAKGQSNIVSPLKSMTGGNENHVESHESSEETENSNHSTICNGDRGVKGKPFVSLSRNKSDWFACWDKNKSENREPVPSLEKPIGDYDVRFKCHRCDIFYDSEEKLHNHLMEHTGVKLCECRFCGKDFTTMTSLKRHLYHHVVGTIPQDCTRCGQTFPSFRDLKDHCVSKQCDISNNNNSFKCFRCRKQTSSLKSLKVHLLSQCNEEPFKYYLPKKSDCSGTERSSVKENGAVEDTDISDKLTKTNDWVSQKFEKPNVLSPSDIKELNIDNDDVEALQILSEVGSSEKGRECWNLQCQNCGHKFENTEKAKVHSELGCGSEEKTTSDKETLKIKVVFEEDGESQCVLNCAECDQKIVGVEKMLLHIKDHIYERNALTCPVLKCEKLFRDPKDFKAHLKAHTGHKPYKCCDCGKRFFLRENYENHAQRHGILKNWSSMNTLLGEKIGRMSTSARSPITIESSITNLEVAEADSEKKIKDSSHQLRPVDDRAETQNKKKKSQNVKPKPKVQAVKKTSPAVNRTAPTVERPPANRPAASRSAASRPATNRPAVNRPSPAVERSSPLIDRPSPAVDRSSPAVDRLSYAGGTSSPATDRSSPTSDGSSPVFNRPSPGVHRPPVILNRPIPVFNRPPAVINRPPPLVPVTSNLHRPPSILNRVGQLGHSSGGSFSVTPQGIFAVGPTRTYAASGPIRPGYAFAATRPLAPRPAPKDPNPRVHPPSYYRISEDTRVKIEDSNAELRKYPRSGRCEVCKKICSRLDKHMMVHLNQKPHLCPVCPQAFRQSEHLRRHIRARHEGNHRQFECPICLKKLTRKDKLKEHMKNCSDRAQQRSSSEVLGDSLFAMIPGPSQQPLEGHTVL